MKGRRRPKPQSLQEFLDGPPVIGQRELADAAGCNQSMISMLIRGKRIPSARLAARLHAITGVPLKKLIGDGVMQKQLPPEFGDAASGHMGFDLDGKPLPMSGNDVKRRVLDAMDDPDSKIVLAVLRHRGELIVQIGGTPSRETLDDIMQAFQTTLNAYEHILKGQ